MSENNEIPLNEKPFEKSKSIQPNLVVLLHLSQLAGFLFPIVGYIAPVGIWAWYHREHPELDMHAREIFNWLASLALYSVAAGMLTFIGIGVILAGILAVLALFFPIAGALKARDGKLWNYPFSIPFFR